MKRLLTTILIIGQFSTFAFAEDSYEPSYEDTSEFLTPDLAETEDNAPQPDETWTYEFELVGKNGVSKTISTHNASVMVKPASTIKLFVGWWAYKLKNRKIGYLSKMLSKSDNDKADETSRRMGGVQAMREWYTQEGLTLNDDNFIAADGSGLSYENKTNCETEMKLLRMIKKSSSYERFKKLLAQPGSEDGTLRTRLTNFSGRLFAKTGTLNKTASLTGFLETPKGTILFCVLTDYLKIDLDTARKKIDSLVKNSYSKANKK